MKKGKILNIIIIILVVAIIAVGALNIITRFNKSTINDNSPGENTEQEKTVNYDLYQINYNEYLEKIASNDYKIILLTRYDCSHCNYYKPYANQLANDYHLDISFLDVSTITETEYNQIHDKYSVLKDYYVENQRAIPTPTTIIIKNNQEIASKSGNLEYNGLKDFLTKNNIIK